MAYSVIWAAFLTGYSIFSAMASCCFSVISRWSVSLALLHQTMTQSATHFTRFRRRLIGKRKNQTHPCYCQYPCNDPIKLFFHAILLLFTGFYPLKPLSPSESGYHMPRHKKLHLCRDIRIPVQYPAQFRHREYNFRSE